MAPLSSVVANALSGSPNLGVRAPSNVVFLSPYERRGVIVMAVAGIISCALVSILLLYIIFSALSPWTQRKPDSPAPFIRKQVAVFVICLLASDFIQSISGILQMKWAMEHRIYEGKSCTAQAATLVMGDLASTIWSCVIAAHTFSSLALGKQWPRWVVYAIVVIGWSVVLILTAIGPTVLENPINGPFFGIAGDWCFITTDYAIPRLVLHYIPLFIAAIMILVLYGLVFLVLKGTISFPSHRVHLSPTRSDDIFVRERVAIAKRMLWYPVAYLTCILPIAVIRLVGLKEEEIPDGVWIFGMFFLFLLGAIDSVIYATTRNVIKKTTRFPLHLNTLNSDASSARTDSMPRKSSMSDADHADVHRALDLTQYVQVRWNDGAQKMGHERVLELERETQPVGAVHVTLERIQEVM